LQKCQNGQIVFRCKQNFQDMFINFEFFLSQKWQHLLSQPNPT
jgi:hypothetical protein